MGGFGSGGHNKRRDHLEGRNRISIRLLRERGLLRSGGSASLSWTDNWGRPTGSIQVAGGESFVTLLYSARSSNEEPWRRIEEQVSIARVPKSYGGAQCYFQCPGCSRRVMELAMGGDAHFRCRTCHGLVHVSSQKSHTDRAIHKARKLKMKLGADPGLDSSHPRPKHMWAKTFARIDAQIRDAEAEVNDAHIRLLHRILRSDQQAKARRMAPGSQDLAQGSFW